MSRQVSLFKFFGNRSLSKSVVKTPKSSEAENNIKRDVRLLLKDVVKNVVDSEIKKSKSETDESYSVLKHDKWNKKFIFWDTKDGKVVIKIYTLYSYIHAISFYGNRIFCFSIIYHTLFCF